jgi:hypothetical protein
MENVGRKAAYVHSEVSNIFLFQDVTPTAWPIFTLTRLFGRQWRAYQRRVAMGSARKLEDVHRPYAVPAYKKLSVDVTKYKSYGKGGVIYVVRMGDMLFKIGRTNNIGGRLRSLNVGRVERVEVVHLIPSKNAVIDERTMHQRYRAYCVKNELFALPDEILAEIKALTSVE